MSTLENKYILSPLESILINKQMPKGYKLETEENLSLSASLSSYIPNEYKNNDNNKFDLFIKKILNNDISKEIYNRMNLSEPSIITIEKNIKNNKYTNLNECYNDLKKTIKFYLDNYKNDENLSNNISKLNEYIDKNYKSIMSLVINENLEKALKTENNTPMTLDEKKALGENIGKLNIEELKGIIKIIQNHTVRDKKVKYLEFDIDKLSVKKCRELESYVRACLGNQYNEALKNIGGDD
jgi:hypothetical protein